MHPNLLLVNNGVKKGWKQNLGKEEGLSKRGLGIICRFHLIILYLTLNIMET